MTPSPWLFDFLKQRTKFRPTAYRAHRDDPWTIGFCHRRGVIAGDTCSFEQAEQWLHDDIASAAEALGEVSGQGQLDVLVALVIAGL